LHPASFKARNAYSNIEQGGDLGKNDFLGLDDWLSSAAIPPHLQTGGSSIHRKRTLTDY